MPFPVDVAFKTTSSLFFLASQPKQAIQIFNIPEISSSSFSLTSSSTSLPATSYETSSTFLTSSSIPLPATSFESSSTISTSSSTPVTSHSCNLCNSTFTYKWELNRHNSSKHPSDANDLKCKHCAKTFTFIQNKQKHEPVCPLLKQKLWEPKPVVFTPQQEGLFFLFFKF